MKVFLRIVGVLLVVGLVLFFTGFTPAKFLDWVDNVVLQNETVVSVVNSVAGFFGWDEREAAVATATTSPGEVQSVGRVAENEIADALAQGVRNFEPTISMRMATPYEEIDSDAMSSYMLAQVERAFAVVRKEYPDIFWMSLGTYDIQWESSGDGDVTLHLQMNYCHSGDTARSMQSQINTVLGGVLADAPADPYEAVRHFHDWIINNTRYASAIVDYASMEGYEYAFNIDGVFLKGSAVCEGYTKAFKLLCDQVGIPCEIVFGVADGENHGWNYVQLDGAWYLVDCTWDDPVSSTDILIWDYFLKGSDSTINGKSVADIYTNDSGVYPVLSAREYEQPAAGGQSDAQSTPAPVQPFSELTLEVIDYFLVEGLEGTRRSDVVAQISASGGAGPYSFSINGENISPRAGMAAASDEGAETPFFRIHATNGQLLAAQDLVEGTYTVEVTVTDRSGEQVTGLLQLEVYPADFGAGDSGSHTHEGVA